MRTHSTLLWSFPLALVVATNWLRTTLASSTLANGEIDTVSTNDFDSRSVSVTSHTLLRREQGLTTAPNSEVVTTPSGESPQLVPEGKSTIEEPEFFKKFSHLMSTLNEARQAIVKSASHQAEPKTDDSIRVKDTPRFQIGASMADESSRDQDNYYCSDGGPPLASAPSQGQHDCQQRCDENGNCKYFSLWLTGGQNWCRLTADCTTLEQEQKHTIKIYQKIHPDSGENRSAFVMRDFGSSAEQKMRDQLEQFKGYIERRENELKASKPQLHNAAAAVAAAAAAAKQENSVTKVEAARASPPPSGSGALDKAATAVAAAAAAAKAETSHASSQVSASGSTPPTSATEAPTTSLQPLPLAEQVSPPAPAAAKANETARHDPQIEAAPVNVSARNGSSTTATETKSPAGTDAPLNVSVKNESHASSGAIQSPAGPANGSSRSDAPDRDVDDVAKDVIAGTNSTPGATPQHGANNESNSERKINSTIDGKASVAKEAERGEPTGDTPVKIEPTLKEKEQGGPTSITPVKIEPIAKEKEQGGPNGNTPVKIEPDAKEKEQGRPTGSTPVKIEPDAKEKEQGGSAGNTPVKIESNERAADHSTNGQTDKVGSDESKQAAGPSAPVRTPKDNDSETKNVDASKAAFQATPPPVSDTVDDDAMTDPRFSKSEKQGESQASAKPPPPASPAPFVPPKASSTPYVSDEEDADASGQSKESRINDQHEQADQNAAAPRPTSDDDGRNHKIVPQPSKSNDPQVNSPKKEGSSDEHKRPEPQEGKAADHDSKASPKATESSPGKQMAPETHKEKDHSEEAQSKQPADDGAGSHDKKEISQHEDKTSDDDKKSDKDEKKLDPTDGTDGFEQRRAKQEEEGYIYDDQDDGKALGNQQANHGATDEPAKPAKQAAEHRAPANPTTPDGKKQQPGESPSNGKKEEPKQKNDQLGESVSDQKKKDEEKTNGEIPSGTSDRQNNEQNEKKETEAKKAAEAMEPTKAATKDDSEKGPKEHSKKIRGQTTPSPAEGTDSEAAIPVIDDSYGWGYSREMPLPLEERGFKQVQHHRPSGEYRRVKDYNREIRDRNQHPRFQDATEDPRTISHSTHKLDIEGHHQRHPDDVTSARLPKPRAGNYLKQRADGTPIVASKAEVLPSGSSHANQRLGRTQHDEKGQISKSGNVEHMFESVPPVDKKGRAVSVDPKTSRTPSQPHVGDHAQARHRMGSKEQDHQEDKDATTPDTHVTQVDPHTSHAEAPVNPKDTAKENPRSDGHAEAERKRPPKTQDPQVDPRKSTSSSRGSTVDKQPPHLDKHQSSTSGNSKASSTFAVQRDEYAEGAHDNSEVDEDHGSPSLPYMDDVSASLPYLDKETATQDSGREWPGRSVRTPLDTGASKSQFHHNSADAEKQRRRPEPLDSFYDTGAGTLEERLVKEIAKRARKDHQSYDQEMEKVIEEVRQGDDNSGHGVTVIGRHPTAHASASLEERRQSMGVTSAQRLANIMNAELEQEERSVLEKKQLEDTGMPKREGIQGHHLKHRFATTLMQFDELAPHKDIPMMHYDRSKVMEERDRQQKQGAQHAIKGPGTQASRPAQTAVPQIGTNADIATSRFKTIKSEEQQASNAPANKKSGKIALTEDSVRRTSAHESLEVPREPQAPMVNTEAMPTVRDAQGGDGLPTSGQAYRTLPQTSSIAHPPLPQSAPPAQSTSPTFNGQASQATPQVDTARPTFSVSQPAKNPREQAEQVSEDIHTNRIAPNTNFQTTQVGSTYASVPSQWSQYGEGSAVPATPERKTNTVVPNQPVVQSADVGHISPSAQTKQVAQGDHPMELPPMKSQDGLSTRSPAGSESVGYSHVGGAVQSQQRMQTGMSDTAVAQPANVGRTIPHAGARHVGEVVQNGQTLEVSRDRNGQTWFSLPKPPDATNVPSQVNAIGSTQPPTKSSQRGPFSRDGNAAQVAPDENAQDQNAETQTSASNLPNYMREGGHDELPSMQSTQVEDFNHGTPASQVSSAAAGAPEHGVPDDVASERVQYQQVGQAQQDDHGEKVESTYDRALDHTGPATPGKIVKR